MEVYSIILAGGKGTRLWPLSREEYPKQFYNLFDKSLFRRTAERALLFSSPQNTLIVTNKTHEILVERELERMEVEIPRENVLFEPEMRGTLPAIYYSILEIKKREEEDALIIVFPSDHFIEVNEEYHKVFREALKVGKKYIVTFGIVPRRPHTGYGYIKPGRRIEGFENAFFVEKFVEKPDEKTARRYVEEGYFWNSGMFVFSLKTLEEECKCHQYEIAKMLENNGEKAYPRLPEISFDCGIMEKTSKAAVLRLNVLWSDLGNFDSIYETFEKDENGNVAIGESVCIESRDNLIYSTSDRLVALIDVSDIIFVETSDASLICRRGSSERVKELVRILEERGDERARVSPTVHRPWGSFTVIGESERWKAKKIFVKPRRRLSLQKHHHRSEHWIVIRGNAKVRVGEFEKILKSGEHIFIPLGEVHRLENPEDVPLEIIEIQLGDYLGEDDIERLEDDFGRV
jgi:mannose-1-phosphate guanylyltransferase/mannose-6-phosphate isomerase